LVSEESPLATFEFRRGPLAGSHLALFKSGLVHRGADGFEAIPLDRIGSLGIGFERDAGRIAWGCVLLFIAIMLLAAFWPLRTLIATALAEVTAQGQGGGFLPASLRAVDLLVGLFPYASVAVALLATVSLALGWIGETVLHVGIAPAERAFAARGRDELLYEFAETVASLITRRG
jgi:hypothetical protein